METLTQIIGNEYEEWRPGNRIYITTPTGSGKTYFILHVLLKHAVETNKRILYLVNRRALKAQVEKDIEAASKEIRKLDYALEPVKQIEVCTYQQIENGKTFPLVRTLSINGKTVGFPDFDYVVLDEFHYFLADANYNTNTFVSFWQLYQVFSNSAAFVFMSATMESMEIVMKKLFPYLDDGRMMEGSYTWPFYTDGARDAASMLYKRKQVYTYSGEADYSHLKILVIDEPEDIKEAITACEGKDKWLIFYNSIDRAKSICKALKDMHIDAISIDAGYFDTKEKLETMNDIIKDGILRHKVTFVTSVVDNGVSISDPNLRNIAVFADTKEDFLQMLGRKRKNDTADRINLYLCKQDKEYFGNRTSLYDRLKKSIERFNMNKFFQGYQPCFDYQHFCADILKDIAYYNDCRKFVSISSRPRPTIDVGYFSNERILMLSAFYDHVHDEMQKDGNAFIKMQLGWLGIKDSKADNIINANNSSRVEELKAEIIPVLEEMVKAGKLNSEQNKAYRNKIRKQICKLIELIRNKRVEINAPITKGDRTYTPEFFNQDMEIIGLPYRMKKDGKSYVVYKADAEC